MTPETAEGESKPIREGLCESEKIEYKLIPLELLMTIGGVYPKMDGSAVTIEP